MPSARGPFRYERSSLFHHVKRIWSLVRVQFPLCQVHCLMESVASMDAEDRATMSADFGGEPWACDAGQLTWCSRPRLYWISWEIAEQPGAYLQSGSQGLLRRWSWPHVRTWSRYAKKGGLKWTRRVPSQHLQRQDLVLGQGTSPRGSTVALRPTWIAGQRIHSDSRLTSTRAKNLLINKQDHMRLPTIAEKEYMLGSR